MRKAHTVLFIILFFCVACSSNNQIAVKETVSDSCKFLGDVAVAVPEDAVSSIFIEDLKVKTQQLKGNTLQCCWEGPHGHFLGEHKSTGTPLSFYGSTLSAKAFYCKANE